MTMTVYTFESAGGSELTYTTQDYAEAVRFGRAGGYLVTENQFEFTAREVVGDFRPKDGEEEDDTDLEPGPEEH